jgi:hypothetical protein
MAITEGKDATGPVAAAVFAKVNVATVTDLAEGGVLTRVPQAPTFRYVRLELPDEEANDHMGRQGGDVLVHVHVFDSYDRYEGDAGALALVDRVKRVLRYQPLTITGWAHVVTRWQRTRDVPSESIEGVPTVHKVVEFTVTVEEPVS